MNFNLLFDLTVTCVIVELINLYVCIFFQEAKKAQKEVHFLSKSKALDEREGEV